MQIISSRLLQEAYRGDDRDLLPFKITNEICWALFMDLLILSDVYMGVWNLSLTTGMILLLEPFFPVPLPL